VGFWDPSNLNVAPDVVKYGNFLGSITPLTISIAGGPATTYTLPLAAPIKIAKGNVQVSWDNTNQWLIISNSGQQNGFYGIGSQPFSIVIGDVYGVLNFPKIEPWYYSTVGLCGYFDGNPNNDFSNSTLFQYLTSAISQRFNGPSVNLWASNFMVYTGGPNAPLSAHTHFDEQGMLVQGTIVPKPYIPNNAEQAAIDTLNFPSIDIFEVFDQMCKSVAVDDNSFHNCMYDAAAVPDFVQVVSPTQNITKSSFFIAQSNAQVKSIAQIVNPIPPNTVTNTDNTAAIGLGVGLGGAALILLIVALIYWNRYRAVDSRLSKALIQLNGSSTKSGREGIRAQEEIRLADNV